VSKRRIVFDLYPKPGVHRVPCEEAEEGTLDCIKKGYNVWTQEGLAYAEAGTENTYHTSEETHDYCVKGHKSIDSSARLCG
jgi:hypothetical protein